MAGAMDAKRKKDKTENGDITEEEIKQKKKKASLLMLAFDIYE